MKTPIKIQLWAKSSPTKTAQKSDLVEESTGGAGGMQRVGSATKDRILGMCASVDMPTVTKGNHAFQKHF